MLERGQCLPTITHYYDMALGEACDAHAQQRKEMEKMARKLEYLHNKQVKLERATQRLLIEYARLGPLEPDEGHAIRVEAAPAGKFVITYATSKLYS